MAKRFCDECGGRRAPDCPHDQFEREVKPLTVDDMLMPSPFEERLYAYFGIEPLHTRLLDSQRAERAGQLRLW